MVGHLYGFQVINSPVLSGIDVLAVNQFKQLPIDKNRKPFYLKVCLFKEIGAYVLVSPFPKSVAFYLVINIHNNSFQPEILRKLKRLPVGIILIIQAFTVLPINDFQFLLLPSVKQFEAAIHVLSFVIFLGFMPVILQEIIP